MYTAYFFMQFLILVALLKGANNSRVDYWSEVHDIFDKVLFYSVQA